MPIAFSDFESTWVNPIGDGTLVAALRGGLSLFMERPFTEYVESTLKVHGRILTTEQRAMLTSYRTETMDRPKPITARAFSTLERKLRDPRPRYAIAKLAYWGGARPLDAPQHLLEFTWFPPVPFEHADAPRLRYVCPGEDLEQNPTRLLELTLEVLEQLPVMSGLGGFVYEIAWGSEQRGIRAAFPRLMRHPAVDVNYSFVDTTPIGTGRGIKGIGWLTVLGTRLVEELGGPEALRAALPRDVRTHGAKHGMVLEIGSAPVLGDVNHGDALPLWREAYRVLRPVHDPVVDAWLRSSSNLDVPPDRVASTERWLRRFA